MTFNGTRTHLDVRARFTRQDADTTSAPVLHNKTSRDTDGHRPNDRQCLKRENHSKVCQCWSRKWSRKAFQWCVTILKTTKNYATYHTKYLTLGQKPSHVYIHFHNTAAYIIKLCPILCIYKCSDFKYIRVNWAKLSIWWWL